MNEPNPYAAPSANLVVEPSANIGQLREKPNQVAATHGLDWFGTGWHLFKRQPGNWILIFLIFLGLMLLLGLIPFLSLLAYVLAPIFTGGLLLGCQSLDRNEELQIDHLFAGFKQNRGNLALVGVLYMVASVLIMLFAGALAFGTLGATGQLSALESSPEALTAGLLMLTIAVLVALVLLVPLLMAYWFAPALVTLHDMPAVAAMQASFKGCLRNIPAFLVYGLVALLLAIVATIPLALGWLVLLPVLTGSLYAGYKDIFLTSE